MAKFTDISIHAPAKGATAIIVAVLIMFALISIHAPAKGATYYGTFDMSILNSFQSTLPRRERRYLKGSIPWSRKFQSTLPRRERHQGERNFVTKILISIHAPAKGATAILYNKFHFLCIILYILSAIT